jgi:SHS2 domain-containing protein
VAAGPFYEIDHTADVALRVHGRDLAELLRNAAAGMIALAGFATEPGPCRPFRLRLTASDAETLLVTWLEEILAQAEAERTLLQDYTLRVTDPLGLDAEGSAAPVSSLAKEIKAVTFHGLQILPAEGGLEASIVFDV